MQLHNILYSATYRFIFIVLSRLNIHEVIFYIIIRSIHIVMFVQKKNWPITGPKRISITLYGCVSIFTVSTKNLQCTLRMLYIFSTDSEYRNAALVARVIDWFPCVWNLSNLCLLYALTSSFE